MIRKEGYYWDKQLGSTRIRLEYDDRRKEATVVIRDGADGELLAAEGCCGSKARQFYKDLNTYFFGYGDRKIDS